MLPGARGLSQVVGTSSDDVTEEGHCGTQGDAAVSAPPGWPQEWRELASLTRSTPGRVFWELFSGTAGLTQAFLNEGWCSAPPIDIVTEPTFDLLNPLFLALVFGIILEGLISVLHLALPALPSRWQR